MKRTLFTILIAAAGFSTFGCGKKSPSAPDIPQVALDQFKNECAACHGADGKGNGPTAAALNPKPRNYTDVAWQASVTDDHIKDVIIRGGVVALGAGHETSAMPPHPDFANKPDLLNGLVQIVRGFKGK
jgi:mono/diheme cytochrome c family protein